jgi:hypothetical protein
MNLSQDTAVAVVVEVIEDFADVKYGLGDRAAILRLAHGRN